VLQDEEDKEATSSPDTRHQPEDRVKPPYSYVAMIGMINNADTGVNSSGL
jgi:hypothetical protein